MKGKKILAMMMAGMMTFGILLSFPKNNNKEVFAAGEDSGDKVQLIFDGKLGTTSSSSEYPPLFVPITDLNKGVNGEIVRITFTGTTELKNGVGYTAMLPKLDGSGDTTIGGNRYITIPEVANEEITFEFSVYDYLAGIPHTADTTGPKGTPAIDAITSIRFVAVGSYVLNNQVKIELITPAESPAPSLYNGLAPATYSTAATTSNDGVIFTSKQLGEGRGNPTINFTFSPKGTSTDANSIIVYPRKLVDGQPAIFGTGTSISIPENKTEDYVSKLEYTYTYTYEEFVAAINNPENIDSDIVDFIFFQPSSTVGITSNTNFKVQVIGAIDVEPDPVVTLPVDSSLTLSGTNLTDYVLYETASYVINVSVSDDGSYELFSDEACTIKLADNKMNLEVGENTAYVQAKSKKGSVTKVYKVTITREEEQDPDAEFAEKVVFEGALTKGGTTTVDIEPKELGKGVKGAKLRFTYTSSEEAEWGVVGIAGKTQSWGWVEGKNSLLSEGKGVESVVEMSYAGFVKFAGIGDDLRCFTFLDFGIANGNIKIELITPVDKTVYITQELHNGSLPSEGGLELTPEQIGKERSGAKLCFTFVSTRQKGWGAVGLAGKDAEDNWLQAKSSPAIASNGANIETVVELTYNEFVALAEIGDDLSVFVLQDWGLSGNSCKIELIYPSEPVELTLDCGCECAECLEAGECTKNCDCDCTCHEDDSSLIDDSSSEDDSSKTDDSNTSSKTDDSKDDSVNSKTDSKTDSSTNNKDGNPGTGAALATSLGIILSGCAIVLSKKNRADK